MKPFDKYKYNSNDNQGTCKWHFCIILGNSAPVTVFQDPNPPAIVMSLENVVRGEAENNAEPRSTDVISASNSNIK